MTTMRGTKLFFFDMDETLTHSKTQISDEMYEELVRLSENNDVVVMSGATSEQMSTQLRGCETIIYAAVSGNEISIYDNEIEDFITETINELTEDEMSVISAHIELISRKYKIDIDESHVQDRVSQVSFSLVGHDADLSLKTQFDPSKTKRKEILDLFPFEHDTLTVSIGGTTCLDYTSKRGTKGKNVYNIMQAAMYTDATYIGDALFPGGNDYSVVEEGCCETLQVNSINETYEFIRQVNNS